MPTQAQLYTIHHRQCGIGVGDEVVVFRAAHHHELGWANAWSPEMNRAVGGRFIIDGDDDRHGFNLHGTDCQFPFFVLRLANL